MENFWTAADAWTNGKVFDAVLIPGRDRTEVPVAFVSTFSDAALLYTKQELAIDDFYNIVLNFKACIEAKACPSYVIVSRNEEISAPDSPALGGTVMGTDFKARYTNIAGSGKAWVNLFLADHTIKDHFEWHEKFSIYCIGDQALPSDGKYQAALPCEGLSGSINIFAIR